MNINDNVTYIYICSGKKSIRIQHRLITRKRHARTINILKLILHYNGIGQRENGHEFSGNRLNEGFDPRK